MFHAGNTLALPSAADADPTLDCTPTQPKLSGAASEPLALGLDEHGGGGGDDFGIASDIYNPLVSATAESLPPLIGLVSCE